LTAERPLPFPAAPDADGRVAPGFDRPVGGDGGYAWWYVDALSDDGVHGLTLIAFIGSVFSPYYAWRDWADPFAHCAINLALYRLDGKAGRWAMTERTAADLTRDADHFALKASSLRWDGAVLHVVIDETTAPIPGRLRGTIRLIPTVVTSHRQTLDAAGRHRWRPIAPRARVEARFTDPAVAWSGDGYFDANDGDEPLERAFSRWHWGRAHRRDDLRLFYDVDRRADGSMRTALHVAHDGSVAPCESPPRARLPNGFWGVGRTGWADAGGHARIIRTLEDAPFYLRSAVGAPLHGETCVMMHESLDLDRLRSPIVRAMLPVRMPRRA
jgi:carotenoid 1,2-hydratase